MLKTRFLVALVALPLLIVVVLIGGWAFAILVFAALVLGGHEYISLLRHKPASGSAASGPDHAFGPPEWLTMALIALVVGAVWFEHENWRDPGLALLLIAGIFHAIWRMERGSTHPITDLALAAFGGVYLGWLGSTLLSIRMLDDGAYFVLALYAIVAGTDTAAYFVGRTWGKHHMTPRVSPKKTWEGYAGSVISGPVIGALVALIDPHALPVLHGMVIGLLIGILGTVGDLGMSAVKRQSGAKDSSHLIPGHGGILDRTDSVLVAAAVGYYYILWFVL